MKKVLYLVATFLMATFIFLPGNIFAQDIVDVAALPPGNVNEVINGDTLAGGVRAHPDRIYRLTRGSVYQVTEAMNINGDLHIIATDGDGRPPVLAPAILPDNSSIDHFFDLIGKGAKVDLNDVYILSWRADGAQLGWSDGIRIYGDSLDFNLKGCVFDGFSHTALQLSAQWCKMDVQDCMFRNNMHANSSWFGGGAFLSDGGTAMDTTKWINNSFFCNNSYNWSIRGFDTYALFEHNSMVLGTVNPFLIRQAPNLHIKNNLFYAAHAMGGNPTHVIDGWFLNYPDTASSSIIRWRGQDSVSYWSKLWASTISGPEAYVNEAVGVTSDMLTADKRVFDVRNNAYVFPQKMVDFYNTYNDTVATKDSITIPVYGEGENNGVQAYVTRKLVMPTWMSDYTNWTLDTLLAGVSNITVSGNMDVDPGFGSVVTDQLDKLLDYVRRIAVNELDTTWYFGDTHYPPTWPLPEDLTYSNMSLQSAGTDGYAVGDLNWFPSQKAQWVLGVETISSNIPKDFSLSDAYPNPFNPETKINFNLAKSANIKMIVYNLLGQKIKTLVSQEMNAGTYSVTWDGKDDFNKQVASGVYLFSFQAESFRTTKKVVLLK